MRGPCDMIRIDLIVSEIERLVKCSRAICTVFSVNKSVHVFCLFLCF